MPQFYNLTHFKYHHFICNVSHASVTEIVLIYHNRSCSCNGYSYNSIHSAIRCFHFAISCFTFSHCSNSVKKAKISNCKDHKKYELTNIVNIDYVKNKFDENRYDIGSTMERDLANMLTCILLHTCMGCFEYLICSYTYAYQYGIV